MPVSSGASNVLLNVECATPLMPTPAPRSSRSGRCCGTEGHGKTLLTSRCLSPPPILEVATVCAAELGPPDGAEGQVTAFTLRCHPPSWPGHCLYLACSTAIVAAKILPLPCVFHRHSGQVTAFTVCVPPPSWPGHCLYLALPPPPSWPGHCLCLVCSTAIVVAKILPLSCASPTAIVAKTLHVSPLLTSLFFDDCHRLPPLRLLRTLRQPARCCRPESPSCRTGSAPGVAALRDRSPSRRRFCSGRS